MLCDDENVEPIAEADLIRYFGEYQAGAGYVLFYQAADIDLVSLGLPPPAEPTKVAETVQEPAPIERPIERSIERLPFLQPTREPTREPDALSPTFSQVGPLLDIDPMETPISSKAQLQAEIQAAIDEYRSEQDQAETPESITPPLLSPSTGNSYNGRARTSSSVSALAPGGIRIGQERASAPTPPSGFSGGSTPARQDSTSSTGQSSKPSNWLTRRVTNNNDQDKSKRSSVYGSSRPSTSRKESSGGSAGYSALGAGPNGSSSMERRPTEMSGTSATGLGLNVLNTVNGHTNGAVPGSRPRSQTADTTTSSRTAPSLSFSSSFASNGSTNAGVLYSSASVPGATPPPPQLQYSPSPIAQPPVSPAAKGISSSSSSGFLGMGKKKDEVPRVPSGGSNSLKRSISGVKMPTLSRSFSSAKGLMGMGKKNPDKENPLASLRERQ